MVAGFLGKLKYVRSRESVKIWQIYQKKTSDMSNKCERGEAAALTYVETNILSQKPDIYTPIKKLNLRTFSSINKKVTSQMRKGEIE